VSRKAALWISAISAYIGTGPDAETDLQTFRAYLLDASGKITWGDWIEAANENEAFARAKELRRDDSRYVEIWLGARKIGEATPIPSEAF